MDNRKTVDLLKNWHKAYYFLFGFILVTLVAANVYLFKTVTTIQKEFKDIKVSVEQSKEANQKVLAKLEEIRDQQQQIDEKQNRILNIKFDQRNAKIGMKQNGIHIHTDLGDNAAISVEDMNKIIDYYDGIVNGGTPFKDKGYVFVKAAEETGLNPIYLFAHAACESGYGNSYLAITRGNYFGINAVDSNPDAAYAMGDSVEAGIMAGARWIKENYYDDGLVTLQQMKDAGYASSPKWEHDIVSVANSAISLL